jgi:hypothetical protein
MNLRKSKPLLPKMNNIVPRRARQMDALKNSLSSSGIKQGLAKGSLKAQGMVANPSIETKSRKNSAGEIINPTRGDVAAYNKKYRTIRFK